MIIEGSNYVEGKWKEYEFHYKPGNVLEKPPIVGDTFYAFYSATSVYICTNVHMYTRTYV